MLLILNMTYSIIVCVLTILIVSVLDLVCSCSYLNFML